MTSTSQTFRLQLLLEALDIENRRGKLAAAALKRPPDEEKAPFVEGTDEAIELVTGARVVELHMDH